MDEAGSRARIRAYHARQPGGTADALAAVKELHEVQDAKAQAVKVGCASNSAADRQHDVAFTMLHSQNIVSIVRPQFPLAQGILLA